MIDGLLIENVPWVEIIISWKHAIKRPLAILDTGFSGDIQITPQIAKELGIKATNIVQVQVANGDFIKTPTSLAVISMENESQYAQVLIADSSPLIGIGLLSKFSYKATVDCCNKTVALQKVT